MDLNIKVAVYELDEFITPTEAKQSELYGEDKRSFLFDIIEFSGGRKGEWRASVGWTYWSVIWCSPLRNELCLEMTYLDQDGVEDILQTISTFFKRTMRLVNNANHMIIPSKITPERTKRES